VILLDTHVAVWMASEDAALGRQSHAMIARARSDRQLTISAISFWEIALLASKRRLALEQDSNVLRVELLNTGIAEIPLSGDIAILAVGLDMPHGDPADRFIVATAIAHGATLITADRALLRWRSALPRHNAAK